MKKHIWIIDHYATDMYYSAGGRHYWFAKYLKIAGYEPVVFGSNTKHGVRERYIDTKDLWNVLYEEGIGVPFVFVRSSLYNSNGGDRILNMINFYRNVQKAAKQYAARYGRPDVIYAGSVHPLTLIAGIKLAKYFGVKCICEVRDLWPESIVAYSSRIEKDSLLARIMYAGERWIYEKADALVFTMAGGADYISSQNWDIDHGGSIDLAKVHHINNGVDLDEFDSNVKKHWFDDADLDDSTTFKVIYAGSIRRVNNLDMLLDAAKLVSDSQIRFVIFGDGDELERLRARARCEEIENVVFKGRIPKTCIPSVDVRADLNLVHWQESPLLRFGDSSNKSFEYFAAGKPVFFTVRPGYSLVESDSCGAISEAYTAEAIAAGIEQVANAGEATRSEMGFCARKVAERHDFKVLTDRLIDVIEAL